MSRAKAARKNKPSGRAAPGSAGILPAIFRLRETGGRDARAPRQLQQAKQVRWPTLAARWDFLLFAIVMCGFLFVATARLADVPVYETDESYTLQVPYEMLHHGRLALPMYRYLGGNIEQVWHSLTPLFFLLLSGFLKLFGFGVLQGRIFNLITVALTLLMVYVVGRRLFDWRAGLAALVLMASDQTVLERARLLRNDYAAEFFALLAFLLYEVAERRKSARFYVGAGLAAGAGVDARWLAAVPTIEVVSFSRQRLRSDGL
jgi:4-amino-4-deoxy-L-arabinose transferase-like glycosyltransferase